MITLEKMSETDFRAFYDFAIDDYAKEKTKAGNYTEEEAQERSKQDFANLLPDGLETENHLLWTITATETHEKAGYLWIFADSSSQTAFIYNIVVFDNFQGKGFGTEALGQLEKVLKERGIKKLELHVFGHNKGAFRLYERLGFGVTNIIMAKSL
ncbi:GNAT family N-acetyltransferase [Bacillus marinisedimentorum]|uniref:GNAT family N-acetyltransferase n=1 Tax=Bacillus marinisedimentorum TaxID=1821260 RepID=UPI0007E22CB2|nr:GNAT family N-acetyltransferase [Bacillus marinisedimentorum]